MDPITPEQHITCMSTLLNYLQIENTPFILDIMLTDFEALTLSHVFPSFQSFWQKA
jgi:hypothetical protein